MIIMLILTILIQFPFNNGYQRYHFRGDPDGNMSVNTYFDKIIPYLRMLIDEQKIKNCMSKKYSQIWVLIWHIYLNKEE